MDTVDLKNVEILRTGNWNGRQWTLRDLVNVEQSFHDLQGVYAPPCKLGHNDEQNLIASDGLPAVGWITALRRAGQSLYADISRVPATFAELLKAGAYRTRSVEVWFDTEFEGRIYPAVLKALSWLGADAPAVSSMADVVALYSIADHPEAVALARAAKATSTVTRKGDTPMPTRANLASGPSQDETRSAVQAALDAAYNSETPGQADAGDGPSNTIVALYGDSVVVSDSDGDAFFEIPYTFDGAAAQLAQPVPVKQSWTPTTQADADPEPDADDPAAEPPPDDAAPAKMALRRAIVCAVDNSLFEEGATLARLASELTEITTARLAVPMAPSAGTPAAPAAPDPQAAVKKLIGQLQALIEQLNTAVSGKPGVSAMRTYLAEVVKKLGAMKWPTPPATAQNSREDDMGMALSRVQRALNMPATATEEECEQEMIRRTATRADLARTQALEETVAKLSRDAAEREAKVRVDLAMRKGQIAPVMAEWALDMAMNNTEQFEKFLATAPKQIANLDRAQGSDAAPPRSELAPTTEALAKKMGISVEDIQKYDRSLAEIGS